MELEQCQLQASEEMPLKDLLIRYPNVVARSFKLKPNVLNCVPSFYSLEIKTHTIIQMSFMVFVKLLNMKNIQTKMLSLDYFHFF